MLIGLGLGLAAVLPLAFHSSVVAVFTLPKFVLLAFAVLTGMLGVLVAALAGRPTVRRTPLDPALLVCAAALAVATVASHDRALSLYGMYNYYAYGVWALALCAAVYYLAAWVDKEESARLLLDLCLGAGALSGACASAQIVGFELVPGVASLLSGGRATSTMGSPVSLGAVLALLVPVALHRALEKRARAFGSIALVVLAAGLVASGARGAWVGAALGAVVYLAWTGRLSGLRRNRRHALAAIAAVLLAGGLLSVRYAQRQAPAESARTDIWRTAWAVFLDSPWLGGGPDTFELGFRRLKTVELIRKSGSILEYQAHAHNDFLEVLATTGLIGMGAYLLLLFSLVRAAAKPLSEPARRPLAAALCAGLLALFVNMKFNPVPLESMTLAALFVGLLLRTPQEDGGASRAWPRIALAGLLVAAASASAAVAVRLMSADRLIKTAQIQLASGRAPSALRSFQGALRLNPCEINYHMGFVNFLSQQAAASRDLAVQRQLLQMAAESGERAVACHPKLSLSHYTLGVAALMQARTGLGDRLAVAERELDAALELDPLLATLLQIRLDAYLLRGDAPAAAEMRRRLEALKSGMKSD